MIKRIHIQEFIEQRKNFTLLDVRTPAEFEKAHIPDAFNLPLFSNEERVQVGTTYKQVGREAAILLGFDLCGNKWRGFIETALKLTPDKKVCVHCWRGGMRSGVIAWTLDLYGFDVSVIEGGYKSYRNWVLQQFEKTYPLLVLGGMTGSHKTEILQSLAQLKGQVIDLETLAQHQGSAYGSMNKMQQPSQEQFENYLAQQLFNCDKKRNIWIEDESHTVGRIAVPNFLWQQMQNGKLIKIEMPREQRIEYLAKEYGVLDKDFLAAATGNIKKRLGPEQTKNALQAISENRMSDFVRIVLQYYDKTYTNCISKRNAACVFPIKINYVCATDSARQVLDFSKTI